MKYFLLFLLIAWTPSAWSAPVKDKHVSAELISEVSQIQAGQPFWVALKLVHDEHWHTYWINDGDSGLPTEIRWELPEGFVAGDIVWPYPQRLEMPPLVSFGYENEAWLLVEITPPETIESTSVTLRARVSWLMCKEICIPGRASFSIVLPVGDQAIAREDVSDDFADARRKIPSTETDWQFDVSHDEKEITLMLSLPTNVPELESIQLFPIDKEIIANSADQKLEKRENGYRLTIAREATVNELPETFRAVLIAHPSLARNADSPAVEISIPFPSPPGTIDAIAFPGLVSETTERSLFVILFFAFVGGLILNLMPCVFPVISLKILGFVKQTGANPRLIWHHGLVFAAGVVVSFWILAGVLLVLRAGGANIGWGFQLQDPTVVILLIMLFFTLALSLFGIFEIGLSLTAAGGSIAQKQGWAGSFFSGFLATIIATPCTAPFMGVALFYALTQPPFFSLAVFTSLALGMSAPYLVLSRYPQLLEKLPRPGPWMETMKQFMGFLLLATVVWLYWVLAALVTSHTLTVLAAALFLLGLASWIYGKWGAISRRNAVRWRAWSIALLIVIASVTLGLQNIQKADASRSELQGEWETFSPERLAELRREGKPVFIDFTAKWCLTCQVNKLTVLRTSEIMQAFRDNGVTLLYADWTDENDVIAGELAHHGRQSVPLYLLYPADTASPPLVLPELLTRGIVLNALNTLN